MRRVGHRLEKVEGIRIRIGVGLERKDARAKGFFIWNRLRLRLRYEILCGVSVEQG